MQLTNTDNPTPTLSSTKILPFANPKIHCGFGNVPTRAHPWPRHCSAYTFRVRIILLELSIYTVSKKRARNIMPHNSRKCGPILIILSLPHFQMNCRKS